MLILTPHESTQDCIKFYYDAKPTIPFKALLKEAENRRRKVKSSWNYAVSVAQVIFDC